MRMHDLVHPLPDCFCRDGYGWLEFANIVSTTKHGAVYIIKTVLKHPQLTDYDKYILMSRTVQSLPLTYMRSHWP